MYPVNPKTREEVYEAIDSERDYQDLRWEHHNHSPEEWLMYIEDYINEAKHIASRNFYNENDCMKKLTDTFRKVAAMSVCAMEQIGVEKR